MLRDVEGAHLIEPAGAVNESGLGINTAEGPTSDLRVRRALSLGTDRQEVIDTVLFGFGELGTKISCGKVPYGWCADEDPPLPYHEYDPEGAKALLAEAGHGDGLDLTMQVNLPLDVQTAEILQEQWARIGVDLTIERIPDFNQQLDNYIKVNHQLSIVSLVWQPDPHSDVYQIYYSSSPINLGKFVDAELDALLDAGKVGARRREADPDLHGRPAARRRPGLHAVPVHEAGELAVRPGLREELPGDAERHLRPRPPLVARQVAAPAG